LTHPLAVRVSSVVKRSEEQGRADAEEPGLQQTIEDGGGDHGVAEDLSPFAEALVRGDDAAAFIAGGDQ
jgi:hypothetical protein